MNATAPNPLPSAGRHAVGYLGTALVTAFVLNWHWELAQAPAFRDWVTLSWAQIVARCAVAALGNVGMTLFVFWLGVIWTRNRRWTWPGGLKTYAALAVLGCGMELIAERLASRSGDQAYGELMPLIPGLKIGAWPILQLTVLIPVAFAFANARQRCINKT